MNEFKQAAERAADAVVEVVRHVLDEHPDAFTRTSETYWAMRDIARIESAKHYAEIEAVFQKLVELAVAIRWIIEFDTNLSAGRNHLLDFDMLKVKMRERDKLLSDPQVKAVMERSKG